MTALYSLYDALLSINVPGDRARAVVDAMERDMTSLLATKGDLALVRSDFALLRQEFASARIETASEFALLRQEFASARTETANEFAKVRAEMALLQQKLIVWLGSMQMVGIGALYALQRLGH